MLFEAPSDLEKRKKSEAEDKVSQPVKVTRDLANNVAIEMLDTYLEHWLPSAERHKKIWIESNPRAKKELVEMIANEIGNDYKLMNVKMLTKPKVKKDMREDFIPRKINQILKKYGAR
jgi:hypothetical protein